MVGGDMSDTISALVDDELGQNQIVQTVDTLLSDTAQGMEQRLYYSAYCLIGDALRGDALGQPLAGRVALLLADEPTLLCSKTSRKQWPVLALAASVACIALILGMVLKQEIQSRPNLAAETLTAGELASALSASAVQTPDISNDMVDYVFAHQSYSQAGYAASTANQIRTISMATGGRE